MDSNSTVHKINRSRYNLTKYLSEEWETDVIKEYSDSEIEKLYKLSSNVNNGLDFGAASGCNITLYHKMIPSHRLHIIYYNFPEIGRPPVKINKQCAEKLRNLYTEEIISEEDSLIVILLNPVPENLLKNVENLYTSSQENLIKSGLSEKIKTENEKLGDKKYNNNHFKNIHIYHLDALSIDILEHSKVPEHIVYRDESTIQEICAKCNCQKNQLPIIERGDAVAKRLRIAPGDICKIKRITSTAGVTEYYRVCK
jgi:DNA-directed RNA polymerase subunit H (RpoH/RPB5)